MSPDEEIEAWRLSNLPKVTEQVRRRPRTQVQADLAPRWGSHLHTMDSQLKRHHLQRGEHLALRGANEISDIMKSL